MGGEIVKSHRYKTKLNEADLKMYFLFKLTDKSGVKLELVRHLAPAKVVLGLDLSLVGGLLLEIVNDKTLVVLQGPSSILPPLAYDDVVPGELCFTGRVVR